MAYAPPRFSAVVRPKIARPVLHASGNRRSEGQPTVGLDPLPPADDKIIQIAVAANALAISCRKDDAISSCNRAIR